VILRANGYRLFSGLIFAGGCSLGVAGALTNEQGTRPWWSVLAAICAVFVVRTWRLGVVIGGDRLVIRSWWRSYAVSFDQIVRVSRTQYSGAWMRNGTLLDWWDQLIIETVAGSKIEVAPIVGWDSRSGDGTVARRMRDLDLLIAQHRAVPEEDPKPITE